jgi:predicted dehydrogenase
MTGRVTYNFEYDRRIRCCFIGAGGHAFRNIYPTFRYAPIDLTAVCDLDRDRAEKVGRLFGATTAYDDHHQMLAQERPELVFIVTSYTAEGRVQATALALDVLASGAHVWMEKPTCATTEEVDELEEAAARAHRIVMTGLKKTFFPAIVKLHSLIGSLEFGALGSVSVRYPERLPRPEDRGDLVRMQHFLDHIYHPGAILGYLGGQIERASYEWNPVGGSSVTTFRFASGAVGALHLTGGQSWAGPLERVEIVGEGAHAIVENGTDLTVYPRAELPSYGRASDWLQPDETAPRRYVQEHSLGQLYNNNLFYLGYVGEVLHICEAILDDRPISRGTLAEVRQIMRLFEFYRTADAGVPVTF